MRSQLLLSLAVLLFFSITSFAAPRKNSSKANLSQQEEQINEVSLSDILSLYTVKVFNANSPVFTLDLEMGHGTGFVVEKIKNDKGISVYRMFTNKHVIETKRKGFAQNLLVSFHSQSSNQIKLKADLVYTSPLHDFAVLEVPVSEVKKYNIATDVSPLPWSRHRRSKALPHAAELNKIEKQIREAKTYFDGIKGQEAIAVGNPFDGENVITFGSITAFNVDPMGGPFIQTQTPINPGNSGGPLFIHTDENHPLVVGMNTAIIQGANNVGFSIPIGVLMNEYQQWKQGHNPGSVKHSANFSFYSKEAAEYLGFAQQIKKVEPEYFDKINYVLSVARAHKNSALKKHDLILKANGHFVGTLYQFISQLLSIDMSKQKHMEVEVLRDGAVVKVVLDLEDQKMLAAKYSLDFVYVSGHVFQRAPSHILGSVSSDITSRVTVTEIVDTPEMQFVEQLSLVPPDSLIETIEIDTVKYPIKHLADLKKALLNTRKDSQILVYYYPAVVDEKENKISHDLKVDVAKIPAKDIFTSRDLSLRKIRQGMDLSMSGDSNTRDWRNYLTPRSALARRGDCDTLLKKESL